ncbi:MAG TPA: glycosyltransferase [Terriglobales bacterium]|nr:glycosyltransferase [Terriglobales bacterium]
MSVIIPAFNEQAMLPRLIESVHVARGSYSGGVEIIVADNCSIDDTAQVAKSHGCRVVRVEKKSIGAARNGGAAVATGDILCFVDADSRIHPHTFNAIENAMQDGSIIAGSTSTIPERWSMGIRATYALMMAIAALTRVDTGVVFCRRTDFQEIGGFQESRLFAEDIAFQVALRRLGRRRGQHLTRLTQVKALLSTRKFDEFGEWHLFTMGWRLLVATAMKRYRSDFTDRYWYKPKR